MNGIMSLLDSFFICKCGNWIEAKNLGIQLIVCSECGYSRANMESTYDLKKEYQNKDSIEEIMNKYKLWAFLDSMHKASKEERDVFIKKLGYPKILDYIKSIEDHIEYNGHSIKNLKQYKSEIIKYKNKTYGSKT